jgi:hypothetical protein
MIRVAVDGFACPVLERGDIAIARSTSVGLT